MSKMKVYLDNYQLLLTYIYCVEYRRAVLDAVGDQADAAFVEVATALAPYNEAIIEYTEEIARREIKLENAPLGALRSVAHKLLGPHPHLYTLVH